MIESINQSINQSTNQPTNKPNNQTLCIDSLIKTKVFFLDKKKIIKKADERYMCQYYKLPITIITVNPYPRKLKQKL